MTTTEKKEQQSFFYLTFHSWVLTPLFRYHHHHHLHDDDGDLPPHHHHSRSSLSLEPKICSSIAADDGPVMLLVSSRPLQRNRRPLTSLSPRWRVSGAPASPTPSVCLCAVCVLASNVVPQRGRQEAVTRRRRQRADYDDHMASGGHDAGNPTL